MSRSIQWHILFPKQSAFQKDQLTTLARQIDNAEFQLVNPHLGRIILIGGEGEGFVPVLDEVSAFEYITAHATSVLSLWKGDLEVALEFDPAGSTLVDQAEVFGMDDDSYFGTIVIHLDRTYLREPSRAVSAVSSVERLFRHLCGCLNAPFGFAVDEWSVEVLANDWHVQRQVEAHAIPSIRFPVNYYSAGYFPDYSSLTFERLGYKCDQVDSAGYLVTNLEELLE